MNIAMIFAGGTGQRMRSKAVPKQFLELHGKPIIIYTLEQFENHVQIDGIVVVCLEEWIPHLRKLLKKFGIEKVRAIVPGGINGQMSIYNGLKAVCENYPMDSVVLIHDGVRPLVDEETISDNIMCVKRHGNAITVTPAIETITIDNVEGEIGQIVDRSKCHVAKAPQSFVLRDIIAAHERAIAEDKLGCMDSAKRMRHYGHRLYAVEGKSENNKITTPADFYIFRAIVDARENSQIFGL